MSNLNELLETLHGSQTVETPATSSATSIYLDQVFIEKLASAVDYLADGFDTDIAKEANVHQVKANLAEGMSMAAAVKAAYPNWDDEQIKSFIAQQGDKLKASPKEGSPEEAKKDSPEGKESPKALLAQKMLAGLKDKEASADETGGVVDKLRSALKVKVAAQVQESQEEESSFIDSVMSKIEALNVEAEKTAEDEPNETEATEVSSEEPIDVANGVSEEDEPVSKEASEDSDTGPNLKLSLAEMLKSANLKTTEEAVESVSSRSVKTAAEQGSTISGKLKNSLLSKVRTEV
jgi:hypothetical protein